MIAAGAHVDRALAQTRGREHVLVVERAPQRALLERAALFVSHAGALRLKEAVNYGVPVLAIQFSHNQPAASVRLSRCTVSQLARAIRTLLDDGSFGLRMTQLRARTLSEEPLEGAVARIETVLTSQ